MATGSSTLHPLPQLGFLVSLQPLVRLEGADPAANTTPWSHLPPRFISRAAVSPVLESQSVICKKQCTTSCFENNVDPKLKLNEKPDCLHLVGLLFRTML